MNYLWKIVRTIMAVVGGFLIMGGVGTSDLYVLEMGQPEPSSVGKTIFIGLVLMVPALLHCIRKEMKEKKQ